MGKSKKPDSSGHDKGKKKPVGLTVVTGSENFEKLMDEFFGRKGSPSANNNPAREKGSRASVRSEFNGCSVCGNESSSIVMFRDPENKRPGGRICKTCTDVAHEIFSTIDGRKVETKKAETKFDSSAPVPAPVSIKEKLDEYVVGQERAKRVLSVAVHNHYKRVKHFETPAAEKEKIEIKKSNVLLLGPTGTGKTLLAETIAKSFNVPMVAADATSLTPTGYVGADVESVLAALLIQAGGDVKAAQRGIVCIDEIDKLASRNGSDNTSGRDIKGEELQRALLKMLEGKIAQVSLPGQDGKPNIVEMDTKNILFVLSGAFVRLADIVRARIAQEQKIGTPPSMGFGSEPGKKKDIIPDSEVLKQVKTEDLLAYGFIPEFVGRIPVVTATEALDAHALEKILTEPRDSIIRQYQTQFAMDGGPSLRFEPEAVSAIAEKALSNGTGARGLRTIVEKALEDVSFSAPGTKGLSEIVITADVVNKGADPLYVYDGMGNAVAVSAASPQEARCAQGINPR